MTPTQTAAICVLGMVVSGVSVYAFARPPAPVPPEQEQSMPPVRVLLPEAPDTPVKPLKNPPVPSPGPEGDTQTAAMPAQDNPSPSATEGASATEPSPTPAPTPSVVGPEGSAMPGITMPALQEIVLIHNQPFPSRRQYLCSVPIFDIGWYMLGDDFSLAVPRRMSMPEAAAFAKTLPRCTCADHCEHKCRLKNYASECHAGCNCGESN